MGKSEKNVRAALNYIQKRSYINDGQLKCDKLQWGGSGDPKLYHLKTC